MTATPEYTPLETGPEISFIPEKPAKHPLETLQQTFRPEDIASVSAYQEDHTGNIERLLGHNFPDEFDDRYHRALPLLTYNTTIYPSEIEERIKTDPVIQALEGQRPTPEKARTLCARRSVLVLLLSLPEADVQK